MSNTDQDRGTYAPTLDNHETFDARDAEQDRRGWLFLGAALVVFVLFVAVVWNTFQLGVRERDASPIISADAEPFRVPPADPGGYQAPDQDLGVTRLREGGGEGSSDSPATSDGDAAPQPRTVREEPTEPAATRLPPARIETADADAMNEPEESSPSRESETSSSDSQAAQTQTPTPAPRQAPRPEQAQPVDPAPIRTGPPPSDAPTGLAAATREGPYVAQIAAYRSSSDAESGWVGFLSRFPELAAGRGPDIQRADLGDRGVYHRLRIAGFATREDAAAYCAALEDRGQACLVARR